MLSYVRLCHPIPPRLLCPWHFSSRNTGVAISFSRGIAPTRGLNLGLLGLLHWLVDSLHRAIWKSSSAVCLKMLLLYF